MSKDQWLRDKEALEDEYGLDEITRGSFIKYLISDFGYTKEDAEALADEIDEAKE